MSTVGGRAEARGARHLCSLKQAAIRLGGSSQIIKQSTWPASICADWLLMRVTLSASGIIGIGRTPVFSWLGI